MIWVDNQKWLYESEQEALLDAWEGTIRNKDELLVEIEKIKAEWVAKSQSDSTHSVGYYHVLLSLIDRFKGKIQNARLFDTPEYWYYYILVNSEGIKLSIDCTDSLLGDSEYEDEYPGSIDPDGIVYFTKASYDLIKEEAKKLTVEEYATIYGVDSVTVRQWIRRGKIRCAIKKGNEWRIPELYDLPKRGYTSAEYEVLEHIQDIPSEYFYLNEYKYVYIDQDAEDKNQFTITLEKIDETTKTLKLSKKEKEKLELLLISNPSIRWVDQTAMAYFTKS